MITEIEAWTPDGLHLGCYLKFGKPSASAQALERRARYRSRKGRRAAERIRAHARRMAKLDRWFHHRYAGGVVLVVRHHTSDPRRVDIPWQRHFPEETP